MGEEGPSVGPCKPAGHSINICVNCGGAPGSKARQGRRRGKGAVCCPTIRPQLHQDDRSSSSKTTTMKRKRAAWTVHIEACVCCASVYNHGPPPSTPPHLCVVCFGQSCLPSSSGTFPPPPPGACFPLSVYTLVSLAADLPSRVQTHGRDQRLPGCWSLTVDVGDGTRLLPLLLLVLRGWGTYSVEEELGVGLDVHRGEESQHRLLRVLHGDHGTPNQPDVITRTA